MKRRIAWLLSGSTCVLAVPAAAQVATSAQPDNAATQSQAETEQTADAPYSGPEIVVTAQKRAESLQEVPIAVSAYTEEGLRLRGIDGAGDLVETVPNLVFQKSRGTLQIRGVGRQLTSAAGDDGVGVHTNGAPLFANALGLAEFYDVERVEVLRGPQGTLYGRSATGGVINVITNKPDDDLSSEVSLEVGNYGNMRAFGYLNVPLADGLGVRVAGFGLSREGYTTNVLTGDDTDNRGIWSGRVTLGYDGGPFRAYAMWEAFREDDSRGSRKALCAKDPGLTTVLGVPTGAAQVAFTQGCLPRSVFADDVYSATNTLSTFAGILARQTGIQPFDSFAGKTISRDLRETELLSPTTTRGRMDLYQLGLEWDITNALTVTSLTAYSEVTSYLRADTTYGLPTVPFPRSPLAPNGVVTSGVLGTSDRFETGSIVDNAYDQLSQEVRLQSSFDGPFNFNIGGIYAEYNANPKLLITGNVLDTIARALSSAIYVDPLRDPDYTGHNYFLADTRYHLNSAALMGEFYYEPSDTLQFTLGLRYTIDNKTLTGSGSTLLTPGRGQVFNPQQEETFRALTGRFNVSWSPDLSFTDSTLIYASAARGYKSGGFNTPGVVALGLPTRFEPEFVDGIEIGTKNLLADGRVMLNLNGFYYNYDNYQVSRQVNRATFVENVNARIAGVEFEGAVEPLWGLRFNANVGYLRSEIREGQAVDSFYRNQGDPTYIVGNSTSGGCILNAAGVAAALQAGGAAILANSACAGPATVRARFISAGVPAAQADALAAGIYTYGPNVALFSSGAGDGVRQDLSGNWLPDAPRLTISLGAQYAWDLGSSGWNVTVRGDYYRQSSSYSRINNAYFDRIRPWTNVNGTLTFDNPGEGFTVQFYVKNALDQDTITDVTINDENLGSFRTVSILDPRLFGVLVTKRF